MSKTRARRRLHIASCQKIRTDAVEYDLLTDEGFEAYVNSIDERLLADAEGRRSVSAMDPLAFALIYFPHHLKSDHTNNTISFSDLHITLIEHAKRWIVPNREPRQNRHAYVAPRESGKSTWVFFILLMWVAAHEHIKFIAAFADTGPQSLIHLQTFKRELENNELLRNDFPELCTPAVRNRGVTEADTKKEYIAASGFKFVVRGVDQGVVGLKIGNLRPQLIILDDVEPLEDNYSELQAQGRLTTIEDGILALNEHAHVVFSGTVTMVNSVVHQLVRTVSQPEEEQAPWVAEQNFQVHYFKPIVVDEKTGDERSIWPRKWTLAYLRSIMHTRAYKKNFLNDPMGKDGDYWNDEDFAYEWLDGCSKTLLSVDPFVKKKKTSDPCGLAVVSYLPKQLLNPNRARNEPPRYRPSRCMVEYADDCNKTGKELRDVILRLLEAFPHIGVVWVEDNQGKDLWRDILHDLPVKLICEGNTVNKEVRAGQLHTLYQSNRVVHARRFGKAEEQMVSFPGTHDDIVDAIGNGVFRFIKPPVKPQSGMQVESYL